jgi:hypothetical protein
MFIADVRADSSQKPRFKPYGAFMKDKENVVIGGVIGTDPWDRSISQ